MDCIFCTIANGDTTKLVWHNDVAAAFKDLHPKAPVHILVVPKQHVDTLDDLKDPELAGQILLAVSAAAEAVGVKGRYRVAANVGRAAGQVIDHLHFHILARSKADEFETAGAEQDQASSLI